MKYLVVAYNYAESNNPDCLDLVEDERVECNTLEELEFQLDMLRRVYAHAAAYEKLRGQYIALTF